MSTTETNYTRGPLISFGTGGLLGGYYIGVISFLRDHFDLIQSDISISGVSCGAFAAFIIFLELSICQSLEYLFLLRNLFSNRTLKILLVSTSKYLAPWHVLTQIKFKKTDEFMKKQYNKFSSVYFGSTSVSFDSWFPWLKKILMGADGYKFNTVKEMMYAMTISSRILPFYRTWGKWKNHNFCFDGGATQNFAISDYDANNRGIISISAFSNKSPYLKSTNNEETVCPNPDKEIWTIPDIMKYDLSLDQQIDRYKLGYLSASKVFHVKDMIKKKLIWRDDQEFAVKDIDDEDKWNKHIQDIMDKNINQIRTHFDNKENRHENEKKEVNIEDYKDEIRRKRRRTNCCSIINLYSIFLCLFILFLIF